MPATGSIKMHTGRSNFLCWVSIVFQTHPAALFPLTISRVPQIQCGPNRFWFVKANCVAWVFPENCPSIHLIDRKWTPGGRPQHLWLSHFTNSLHTRSSCKFLSAWCFPASGVSLGRLVPVDPRSQICPALRLTPILKPNVVMPVPTHPPPSSHLSSTQFPPIFCPVPTRPWLSSHPSSTQFPPVLRSDGGLRSWREKSQRWPEASSWLVLVSCSVRVLPFLSVCTKCPWSPSSPFNLVLPFAH